MELLDPMRLKTELVELVRAQKELYEEVLKRLSANRAQMRAAAHKGTVLDNRVGFCGMVAGTHNPGSLLDTISM